MAGVPLLLFLLLSLIQGSTGKEVQDTGERIINGAPCPRGAQPWQVALFDGKVFECAGVLIRKQWVLTVAHCYMREYIIQMGSDLLDGDNAQQIRATNSFIYPKYDNYTDTHDIMLIKLNHPARLSSAVKIANVYSNCKGPGTSCTVSGWGINTMHAGTRPSELTCSNVNLMFIKDCRQFYPMMLNKFMMCAAPPDGLSNACRGDSGSPLMCEGSLQGLVSSGYFPCQPHLDPVMYTRLCKYRKWIYDTIKDNS